MKKTKRDTAVSLESIQVPVRPELLAVQSFIHNIILDEFFFLEEVAQHITSMKGKLFRPTLLLLSGSIVDGTDRSEGLVPMAIVVEMIHTATLVHDDFIDNATIRRGLQTLNDRWSDQVSIIMGDYLYSRSLTEMVEVGDIEVMRIMSEASRRIALGEMKELNLTSDLYQSEEQYYDTIRHKTAALISAACEVGAVLGRSDERDRLRDYGENLGMAFQVVDDVFDYTGKSSRLGKVVGTDLREKKATLPLIHALRDMTAKEKKFVEEIFSKKQIKAEDISEISRIIQKYDGFDYSMKQAISFAEEARKSIEDISPSMCKDSLLDAVEYVVERDR